MKKVKTAVSCVLFLLLCAFVLERTAWVFKSNLAEARENMAAYTNAEPMDVILCDGSCVLRFYEPMTAWKEKGIASYNCATSACTADMIEYALRESRATGQRPLLYICELRTLLLLGKKTSDTDESSIRNWSDSIPTFSVNRWAGVTRFLKNRGEVSAEALPSYYIDLFKYHSQTQQLAEESQWRYLDRRQFHSVSRGYGITAPVHTPFVQPAVTDEIGELSELQEKTLDRLLNYCEKEDLPILFTCCPFIIGEADWLTMNAAAKRIADRGFDFVNFNRYYREIGLDFETDFKDINHVNQLGAEKYTAFLIEYLSSRYDLPDHRGEAMYAAWDADIVAYDEMRQVWRERTETLIQKHLAARETGKTMPQIEAFRSWYAQIQDDDFTVLIQLNQPVGDPGNDSTWTAFLKKYAIDPDASGTSCAWCGKKQILPSEETEDGISTFEIGVDSGRGQDRCELSAARGMLTVDGRNYFRADAAAQVVVYDNNYKEVVDSVTLHLNENGMIELIR